MRSQLLQWVVVLFVLKKLVTDPRWVWRKILVRLDHAFAQLHQRKDHPFHRPLGARLHGPVTLRDVDSFVAGILTPTNFQLERIGTHYGGWVLPIDLVAADWICYCGGVGEDISFDLGLIERFGCQIYAFDPTPRAYKHVEMAAKDVPAFHFYPVGLWSKHKTMRFYAPKKPEHVSHSILNLQGTSEYFTAIHQFVSPKADR